MNPQDPDGRSWLRRTVVSLLAALSAILSLAFIPSLLSAQQTADFFHADQVDVRHLTGTVSGVSYSSAKNHRGTSAQVAWDGGAGTISLSSTDDVRDEVPADHRLPVAVWHREIIAYEFGGDWHTTGSHPDRAVRDRRLLVAFLAFAAAFLGRIAAHAWLHRRVNHDRFLAGDLSVLPFAVATLALAFTGHTTSLAWLAPLTLAVLLLSVFVLPAAPWVKELDVRRPAEPAEPEAAPHPDFDMRKRPVGQRLW